MQRYFHLQRFQLVIVGFILGFYFVGGLEHLHKVFEHYQLPLPVVTTTLPDIQGEPPVPKRDASVMFYLEPSVRILAKNSVGSGTICYYDDVANEIYIISCGHLFEGSKRPGSKGGVQKVVVEVFYKNGVKLNKPQPFEADVICYDNEEDISFLRFSPDWVPNHYFPIAPLHYPIGRGKKLESTGCDEASEVASYTVQVVDGITSGKSLITKDNSPRPGRSGGGLISPDGFYVGIVWATTALDGTGYGLYVPLRRIHAYASRYKELSILIEGKHSFSFLHHFPIIDQNGNSKHVPPGYLPVP